MGKTYKLCYNFTKGLNLIQNFCVRPWAKDIQNALQNKLIWNLINKKLNLIANKFK